MKKGKRKKRSPKNIAPFILAGLACLIGGFAFFIFSPKNEMRDSSTPYPTLYSDTHITENAKVVNPQFAQTTFTDREDLVASVSLSIQTNKPSSFFQTQENGTWLWTPTLSITPSYTRSIIDGASKNNIQTIYLSIDSYLDIFVMKDGVEKEAKKKTYDSIVQHFIQEANKKGISVDAEAGWRNWAEEGNVYKAFAVLDYAIEFNKNHDVQFRGFQYDVEPYMLENYPENKRAILRNFLRLINETVTRLNNTDLAFSVVIPEFYDGEENLTPRFLYAWRFSYAYDHLLRILERRPGSSIIVMAYRNFSEGENSSVAISQDEITKANKTQSRIIIAQETGNVPPPYITFHNTSHRYYQKQLAAIENSFSDQKSFGGIATHYINALLELR